MHGLKLSSAAIALIAVVGAYGAMAAVENVTDRMGDIRLKGYLGDRLDKMIERHVMATDIDYITAPYFEKTERKNWWQTEFWGKYMHAAVPYLKYVDSAKLRASVNRGVERVISTQEPSGYIGNYPDELRCGEGWDVWGMKYTMMGLLHYYDLTQDAKSLAACRRLCDYVIAELGPNGKRGRELWETGNWSGYASSSILEPVMWLYLRTNENKYLDFASYLVEGMTKPEQGPRLLDLALKGVSVADRNGYGNKPESNGGYVMKHNRWKAYEMMSCYQGLLEYYQVTGRKELFEAALKTGEDIIKEEINLAGGCACSEAWFHGTHKQHIPYYHLQETCVTTTWMRFCEKLLNLTDDPKWADQIERTFYNAYLGALKPDGSVFAAYTPLIGYRWRGMIHCYMHLDCCTSNGPRGFLCFLKEFYRCNGETATFNFYSSALVKGFEMYSQYPRQDFVRIVSHTQGKLNLRLRIPAWSAKTEIKLNGKAQPNVKPGTYYTIANDWKHGDIIEIKFDMPVVAHTIGEKPELPHYIAFTRGPILLARDSRFGDGDLAEPMRYRSVQPGQKFNFTSVKVPSEDMWMAFAATLSSGTHSENPEGALPTMVNFCDYASAGNAWRRDNYYRTWFEFERGPRE